MTLHFKGLIAPTEVPTGDGRMFAAGKMTHRPLPIPLLARFSSGGHDGATVVGKITSIFQGPGGYWGAGDFLDPTQVPEVGKAVYMLQNKVMGPSVDLDRDFTVESVPHPLKPDKKAGLFKEYNVIGTTLVPMPAFHQVHLSVDNPEDKSLLASVGIDWIGLDFDVNNTDWQTWPVAPRNYVFDADDAVKRIAYWAGIGSKEPNLDKYSSTFLWRKGDEAGSTMAQDSFRLPLADIINGEPYLIYHAVYSAAALLSGAHGGLPQISDDEKANMILVINDIYHYLADKYQDANLKSPFQEHIDAIDRQAAAQASVQENDNFAAGSSLLDRTDEECGCDSFSGDTEGDVPTLGDVPMTTPGQTLTLGTNTGTFTMTAATPVQSITFNMMPTSMPAMPAVPTGVSGAPGMAEITVIPLPPADVLKSADEEQQPYDDQGNHPMVDGICTMCNY